MGYGADFKSGGYGEAYATGYQDNSDPTKLVNKGADLGVALPDVKTDEDVTKQGQNATGVAEGGSGGSDNAYQSVNV